MSVNYSCQPGFSLLGDPSIQCMEGSWSLPYPRCAGEGPTQHSMALHAAPKLRCGNFGGELQFQHGALSYLSLQTLRPTANPKDV